MAQSRLEKVGTIYTRVCSLLKTGAMKEENKPIWLEIYKTFPPKYEPCYDRKTPASSIKQIFYSEDNIRARFHKDYKNYSMVNLMDERSVSKTEHFLDIYKQLQRENIPEEELYDTAVKEFLTKFKSEKPQKESEDSESVISQPKFLRTRKSNKSSITNDSEAKMTKESTEDEPKYKPIKLRLDKIMEDIEEDTSKKSS